MSTGHGLTCVYIFTENATSVEIGELLAELDLMKNMKPHENILNLLGHCTTPGVFVLQLKLCISIPAVQHDSLVTL